jgi:hypothetical protein
VHEFLCWAFLNRAEPETKEEEVEVDGYVAAFERLLKEPLLEGKNGVKCIRTTLDPVRMTHRSLIWYLVGLPQRKTGGEG